MSATKPHPVTTASQLALTRRSSAGRTRIAVILASLGYLTFLLSLLVPTVQRNLLYLHNIRFPINAEFDRPGKYGLSPYKVRNVKIVTTDNETLGAWHMLPHSVYSQHAESHPLASHPLNDDIFDNAINIRPTILYFHGNAASRAQSQRIRTISDYSYRLDCNVLALDYRGFADSSGSPSETGLLEDALAGWKWIISRRTGDHGAQQQKEIAKDVIVVGHSLGTGVAGKLIGELADKDIYPRALVLIAPFSSLHELLVTYRLAGIIPLLGPFRLMPGAQDFLLGFLCETWDTASKLVRSKSPTLIVHAADDTEIPSSHSRRLFETLRGSTDGSDSVPTGELSTTTTEDWGSVTRVTANGRDVVWFEAVGGGHNAVGNGEGVVELIREIAGL